MDKNSTVVPLCLTGLRMWLSTECSPDLAYFLCTGPGISKRNTVVFFTITLSWQCWHYCQLCISIYLQLSSLFVPTVFSKCEFRNQGVHEDYMSRLNALLEWLIFNGRAKTKLAMLAFLYCVKFLKNSCAFAALKRYVSDCVNCVVSKGINLELILYFRTDLFDSYC